MCAYSRFVGQERFSEAEPLYQQSLAIFVKVRGSDHPDVATLLNNLAGSLKGQVMNWLVSARIPEVIERATIYSFAYSLWYRETVRYA